MIILKCLRAIEMRVNELFWYKPYFLLNDERLQLKKHLPHSESAVARRRIKYQPYVPRVLRVLIPRISRIFCVYKIFWASQQCLCQKQSSIFKNCTLKQHIFSEITSCVYYLRPMSFFNIIILFTTTTLRVNELKQLQNFSLIR